MDYLKEIEVIISTLASAGFRHLADDLKEQQLSCGTGGEVLISICARILGIKEEYPTAFEAIRFHADKLFNYANSLGLYPIALDPKRSV